MVSYPKSFPLDAGLALVNAATQGIKPDGEHGDKACLVQAAWNILGYGLSVWLPHDHPDLKAGKKKGAAPAPAPLAAYPRKLGGQLQALAGHLAPVAVKRTKGVAVAAPDFSKLPWDQIVALAILIIQSLLKK